MKLRVYLDTNVFVYGLLEEGNSSIIKEKDVENVAAVRHENLEFLVAYDRDYEGILEYITPKGFIERQGIRGYEMEY